MKKKYTCVITLLLAFAVAIPTLGAQEKDKTQSDEPNPLTEGLPQRELSKKEREKRAKALEKELGTHFKKWLDEDVVYIISPEEKQAFLELNNDEEREQFIEQFWLRRDPTPDTIENEFKEEHYRRIAYANERLGGWRTDRGMVYIIQGPPDEIEAMPTGGYYERRPEEGGGGTSVFPFERWRYRYIEGVGDDVELEFVDRCMCGDYKLTTDPSLKDALYLTPGAGLTWLEQMGRVGKGSRFARGDGTMSPKTYFPTIKNNEFDRLERMAGVMKPPKVKFKDLESLVTHRISYNLLPFEMRTDYLRVTDETILVPITLAIKKKDVTFTLEDGVQRSEVNVFGRVTTLTGRIVQTFEDTIRVDVPAALFNEATLQGASVYQKAVPLRPGLYKLNLVLKDLNSGNVGTMERRLTVPRFEDGELAQSSLILADLIQRVPSRNVGTGQFVIGDTKVRPVLGDRFTRDGQLGIYFQVYNLGLNEKNHKPDAVIDYTFLHANRPVLRHAENTAKMKDAGGSQLTVEKLLSLNSFQPGKYKVVITVTDRVRQKSVTSTADFQVLP